MTRLPLLILAALSLSGCNGSSADIDRLAKALAGDSTAPVTLAVEDDSTPAVETVAVAEPPCAPGTGTYDWRFNLYDSCTLELIGPDPKYW